MARKKDGAVGSQPVRKSVTVDPDKLERARKILGASSDAEVLRMALDRVLERGGGRDEEEE